MIAQPLVQAECLPDVGLNRLPIEGVEEPSLLHPNASRNAISIPAENRGNLVAGKLARSGPEREQVRLIRERTAAGLAAARARGRHGGRPSVLTGHKLQVAQEMYRSGQYTVAAIATTLGVSRASIYRHLNVAR